jgi:hypothetical protein
MVLMLTQGSIAISLAETASSPEVVSAKNGKLLAERDISSSSYFTWGVMQRHHARKSARRAWLSHEKRDQREDEVREQRDGETHA